MNVKIFFLGLLLLLPFDVFSQEFTANTDYDWDQWQPVNKWGYIYSGGWVYAVKGYKLPFQPLKAVGNARDFYFRFKYSDLDLHELSRKEWKEVKKNGGLIRGRYCTFEYYVTDQYPSLESALSAHSWPCAKAYLDERKPAVLKSEKVLTSIQYTDDDEVRTLNFFFNGCSFAITVHWDYTNYKMTYSY